MLHPSTRGPTRNFTIIGKSPDQPSLQVLHAQLRLTVKSWIDAYQSFFPHYDPLAAPLTQIRQLQTLDIQMARSSAQFGCLLMAFNEVLFCWKVEHGQGAGYDNNELLETFASRPLGRDEARISCIEEAVGMWREYGESTIAILKRYSDYDSHSSARGADGHVRTSQRAHEINPERSKNEMTRFVARSEEIYHAIQYFSRPRVLGEMEGYHPKWDNFKKTVKHQQEMVWVTDVYQEFLTNLKAVATRGGPDAGPVGDKRIGKLQKKASRANMEEGKSLLDRLKSKSKTKVKSFFFEEPPPPLPCTAPRPAATRRYTYGASPPPSVRNLKISDPIPISPIVTHRWQPIIRSKSAVGQYPGGWTSATDISRVQPQSLNAVRSNPDMGEREWMRQIGENQNQSRRQTRDTLDTDTTLVNAFESLEINRSPKLGSGNRMSSSAYATQPPQISTQKVDRRHSERERRESKRATEDGTVPPLANVRVSQQVPKFAEESFADIPDASREGLARQNSKFVPPEDDKEDPFLHLRRPPKVKMEKNKHSSTTSPTTLLAQNGLRSGITFPMRELTGTISPTALSRHNTTKGKDSESQETQDPFDDILAGYASDFGEEELRRMDAVDQYLEDRIDFFAGRRGSAQGFSFAKKGAADTNRHSARGTNGTLNNRSFDDYYRPSTVKKSLEQEESRRGRSDPLQRASKGGRDDLKEREQRERQNTEVGRFQEPRLEQLWEGEDDVRRLFEKYPHLEGLPWMREKQAADKLDELGRMKMERDLEQEQSRRRERAEREKRELEGRKRFDEWQRQRDEAQWKPDPNAVPVEMRRKYEKQNHKNERPGVIQMQTEPTVDGRAETQRVQFERSQTTIPRKQYKEGWQAAHSAQARSSHHRQAEPQRQAQSQQFTLHPDGNRSQLMPGECLQQQQTSHFCPSQINTRHTSGPDIDVSPPTQSEHHRYNQNMPSRTRASTSTKSSDNSTSKPNTSKPLPQLPLVDLVNDRLMRGVHFPLEQLTPAVGLSYSSSSGSSSRPQQGYRYVEKSSRVRRGDRHGER